MQQTIKSKSSPSRHGSETIEILKAMGELRTGLQTKIDSWNKNNNEKFEIMKSEMEKIRQNFNDRIEGLAKKVETRITKTVTKEFDSKLESMRKEMNDKMKNIISEQS